MKVLLPWTGWNRINKEELEEYFHVNLSSINEMLVCAKMLQKEGARNILVSSRLIKKCMRQNMKMIMMKSCAMEFHFSRKDAL